MGVYQKLAEVQKELKAPKGQHNKFGNYDYRSCEDIIEAAKPLCIANGLVLNVSDSIKYIGERYYIEATATVTDIDDDKQVEITAFAREAEDQKGMAAAQVTGSTSSYARKYALNGLFGIDDTKDDDTKDKPKKDEAPKDKKEAPKDTPVSVQMLEEAILGSGKIVQDVIDGYNSKATKKIDKLQFMPKVKKQELYAYFMKHQKKA